MVWVSEALLEQEKESPVLDEEGNQKTTESGEPRFTTDGYRQTRPGAKGVRTMKLDDEFDDMIISVRKIPNPDDHLFLLTKKGMMIRTEVSQTKMTTGKATEVLESWN